MATFTSETYSGEPGRLVTITCVINSYTILVKIYQNIICPHYEQLKLNKKITFSLFIFASES